MVSAVVVREKPSHSSPTAGLEWGTCLNGAPGRLHQNRTLHIYRYGFGMPNLARNFGTLTMARLMVPEPISIWSTLADTRIR